MRHFVKAFHFIEPNNCKMIIVDISKELTLFTSEIQQILKENAKFNSIRFDDYIKTKWNAFTKNMKKQIVIPQSGFDNIGGTEVRNSKLKQKSFSQRSLFEKINSNDRGWDKEDEYTNAQEINIFQRSRYFEAIMRNAQEPRRNLPRRQCVMIELQEKEKYTEVGWAPRRVRKIRQPRSRASKKQDSSFYKK